jgi:hypothetical protein
LTLTGVMTYGSPFYNAAWARVTHSAMQGGGISDLLTLDFGDQPIELAQNEVLALRLLAVAVIGDNVGGGVGFFGG